VTSREFTLGTRAVARVAAALWLGCGALVASVIPFIATGPHTDRAAIVAVGLVAMTVGAVVWLLPWDRWSERSTLVLVPAAFLMLARFNRAA
jgi:hypothetical protein